MRINTQIPGAYFYSLSFDIFWKYEICRVYDLASVVILWNSVLCYSNEVHAEAVYAFSIS